MGEAPAYPADDGVAYERLLGRWTGRLAAGPDRLCRAAGRRAAARRRLRHWQPGVRARAPLPRPERARGRCCRTLSRLRSGRAPAAPASEFTQADATDLPFADGYVCRRARAARAQLHARSATRDARDAARDPRRQGWSPPRSGTFAAASFFQRLFWDTAAALEPDAGRVRDRLFSHPLALPEGLVELWRAAGLRAVERGSITIRMDFSGLRRLLAAAAGRPGALRRLCRGPSGGAPCADRGWRACGLPGRRSGRPPLADRDRLGGARPGPLASLVERHLLQ